MRTAVERLQGDKGCRLIKDCRLIKRAAGAPLWKGLGRGGGRLAPARGLEGPHEIAQHSAVLELLLQLALAKAVPQHLFNPLARLYLHCSEARESGGCLTHSVERARSRERAVHTGDGNR